MADSYTFENKCVLIVGCVRGIGLELVNRLVKEKIKGLGLLDIAADDGKKLEDKLRKDHPEIKTIFWKCDVTSAGDVKSAYDAVWEYIGQANLVVNCAGILNDFNFRLAIDINISGLIDSSLQAWHRMRKDTGGRGGTVINIGSIVSVFTLAAFPVYCATKHAVKAFTEAMGDEYHFNRTGVRFFGVGPHPADTNLYDGFINKGIDKETAEMTVKNLIDTKNTYHSTEGVVQSILDLYKTAPSSSFWIIGDNAPQLIPRVTVTDILGPRDQ